MARKNYSDPLLKGASIFLIIEFVFILFQLAFMSWTEIKKSRVAKEIIRFYHSFNKKQSHENN